MKLPKKQRVTQTIELIGVDWFKDVDKYILYKEERYFDNKAQVKVKIKSTKNFRQTARDIKAVERVFRRLSRHGWKEKGKEEEVQEERAEQ